MPIRETAIHVSPQPGGRWPGRLARIAMGTAILAVLLLVAAGPFYRTGLLPLLPALLSAAAGFLLFVLAFILGAIGFLAARRGSQARPRGAGALVILAGIASVAAGVWIVRLRAAPPIHDITTDLAEPPAFKDVVPLRLMAQAANPPDYRRVQKMGAADIDVGDAQRRAYPDIRPLELSQSPSQVLRLAEHAARKLGWDIVAIAPGEGRIEATDTTRYFGFKDDVVVRVRGRPGGSRVDVRSESRVGLGDAGTNARRVATYLSTLRGLAAAAPATAGG